MILTAVAYGMGVIAVVVVLSALLSYLTGITRHTSTPPDPPAPRAPTDDTMRITCTSLPRVPATQGVTMDPRWRPEPAVRYPDQPATPSNAARYHCPGCSCPHQ